MSAKTRLALLLPVLLVTGCADQEQQQPVHVKYFEGATNVIAPATGYYLKPPAKRQAEYYLTLPKKGQVPDGQLDDRKKLEVLEEIGEEIGEYVKVRIGEETEAIEAFVQAKFIPDGRFAAGTRVEVLKSTKQYVKVKTGDGMEAYVKPKFIKNIAPEG